MPARRVVRYGSGYFRGVPVAPPQFVLKKGQMICVACGQIDNELARECSISRCPKKFSPAEGGNPFLTKRHHETF